MARYDKDAPRTGLRKWTVRDVDGSRMGEVWGYEQPTGEALEEWRLYLGIWARWARKCAEFNERAALRTARSFDQVSLFDAPVGATAGGVS
jgi:hypothetical protein